MIFKNKILGFVLMLFLMSQLVLAQSTLNGRVNGSDMGEELPGATVLVKGTTIGTTTDLNGNFTLEVKPGSTLTISYIGYTSKDVVYDGASSISVTLDPDIEALEEVVVMGYSTKSKRELAASVTSLEGKELLNGVTSSNVESMLQGKVAGLSVNQSSGKPGTKPVIRMRGITSITADQNPLIVVDGMIGGNYVPSNVASISVLKDAAAIGLYGSAGAAGVIIITTKKARSGVPEFTFSTRLVGKEVSTGNFEMMGGAELYDTQEKMWGDDQVGFLKLRPEDLRDQDFDWLGELFQPGFMQNYTFGVYGKKEGVSYVFDADYLDEEGTFIGTDYQRLNLHTAAGYNGKGRFAINTDVNGQITQDNSEHFSYFEDAFWSLPWDNPYYEDGENKGETKFLNGGGYDNVEYPWYGQFRRNPFHSMKYNTVSSKSLDVVWSTRMTFEITDWLNIETRTRLNSGNLRSDEFYHPNTGQGIGTDGMLIVSQSDYYGVLSTHMLRFNKDFGEHTISGFVAHEGSLNQENALGLTNTNLAPGISVPESGVNVETTGFSWQGTQLSYIAELSYSLRQKYFATLVYRSDQSSNFAVNNKKATFPAASFGWLISEEGFLQGNTKLSFLKFRASYGQVGNNGGDALKYHKFLAAYKSDGLYNDQPAAYPDRPENTELGWETTTMSNLGLDFGFLDDAVNLSVDAYRKNVDGLLLNKELAPSGGYENKWENVGAMNNTGIEAALSYSKNLGDFSYSGNLTFSYNKNEISQITDNSNFQLTGQFHIQQEGNPAFSWYMPKWLGVDPANGAPLWEVIDEISGEKSSTSIYNEATFQTLGAALPTTQAGFSNTFGYKGFALSILLTYQGGNEIYNQTREFVDHDGANTGINLMRLQDGWSRWENPGDIATHPVLELGDTDAAHFTSSRYLEDGAYMRVRNITLTYDFPSRLMSKMKIKGLSLSVGVDNIYTFTNFSGMDPDINVVLNEFESPGLSYLKYPISKQIVGGLNLRF